MAHRKWKEAKQLPDTAGPGNMLGCCLIFFHFLWAIHPIRPVHLVKKIFLLRRRLSRATGDQSGAWIPKYQRYVSIGNTILKYLLNDKMTVRYQNDTPTCGVRPATGVDMALGINGYQVGN